MVRGSCFGFRFGRDHRAREASKTRLGVAAIQGGHSKYERQPLDSRQQQVEVSTKSFFNPTANNKAGVKITLDYEYNKVRVGRRLLINEKNTVGYYS